MKVDPAIYKIAGKWADVVRAHAIVESKEQIWPYGDGGRAFGLLQVHPAFVKDYSRFADILPSDTWPEAEVKLVAAFYELHPGVDLDLLIQAYNQGYAGVMSEGRRAPEYLANWHLAYNRIMAEKNAKA